MNTFHYRTCLAFVQDEKGAVPYAPHIGGTLRGKPSYIRLTFWCAYESTRLLALFARTWHDWSAGSKALAAQRRKERYTALQQEGREMSSHSYPEVVTLRDGATVTLRPIRPDDAPRLQEAFGRLSPESIFQRFLDQRALLPDVEAQRGAIVDYRTSMAIVAVVEEHGEEHIVGGARYLAIDPAKPDTAEAAITVIDEYQRRGLGTILVQHIVEYARTHGIRYFLATVHYSNEQILHFIEQSRLPAEKRLESGAWEIRIRLDAETGA